MTSDLDDDLSGHDDLRPDGPRHDERLWPAPWVWAGAAGLALSSGVVLVPVAAVAALPTTLVVATALLAALLRTSPRVQVGPTGLRAGRALLPWEALGEARELDAPAMRAELGVDLDARAYLCIRGWVPGGVKVTVTDPTDPTPYWLVSSRSAAALAQALTRR